MTSTPRHTSFDDATEESLRLARHLKWSGTEPAGIGACVAEMDVGTAPPIASALNAAITRGNLSYPPPGATAELAQSCAAWQRDAYGWNVSPDDVRPLPDVIRAFHLAIEHFSRPGSPVIVPVPAYPPFLTVPKLLNRPVIPVKLAQQDERYVFNLEALDRAYAQGGHLLALCNPHNPVGRVLEFDELSAIAEVVERHGGRVFADEVHAPLVYPGNQHVPYASTSVPAARHTLTAVSASKAWNLAGLKCAQVLLSNDADRARWERLDRLATDGTSVLGMIAAIAAYTHGRPWLDELRGHLDRNRNLLASLLAEHLPAVRYTPPEGTYLGWLDFRDAEPRVDDLAEFFAERAGVSTIDGGSCGTPGHGFIRVNFATTKAILTRIVQRMADTVSRHRTGTRTPRARGEDPRQQPNIRNQYM